MPIVQSRIQDLVDAELLSIADLRVVNHIRTLLVSPEPLMRDWDYGQEGEAYPCWSVLNHAPSNTGIAYCESGFGPRTPWGLVVLSGSEQMSIGMDSGWFEYFLQAYFDSMAATELPIWRVFWQKDDAYPGTPLTKEATWAATWKEVERLRFTYPGNRYHCSQDIYHDTA